MLSRNPIQSAMLNEACTFSKDDCIRVSCDDKNKINVGTLAVSRYHQIRRFYLEDDQPEYNDHDFPYAGSKIIPSGYLIMETKEKTSRKRSRSEERQKARETNRRSRSHSPITRKDVDNDGSFHNDKYGRMHVTYGRTGPMNIFNRAGMFHSSTAETHANVFHRILSDNKFKGKTVCMIMSDGGPDWSTKSTKTLIYQGRLWRDLNFDYYAVANLAAGHSKENPIEHLWSPLLKQLVSVTLPITLPGEAIPPSEQNISEEEKKRKNIKVFDSAIDQLNCYWNMTHDGFKVKPVKIACVEGVKVYSDHAVMKEFCKSGIKKILGTRAFFLLKHCTRRTNMLEFVKCRDTQCNHCTTNTVRKTKFMDYIG
ncbi:uncharacterized protein LOC117113425 [Anneissia japonica]|uniref:uncharacterized protein LOC117113425 n=1 Tax=Anneissia japonica TaxID=1529436 RepID=UPI001425A3BE|nr:uncharacterized protein LOC117113425 [Anneissia japonica]